MARLKARHTLSLLEKGDVSPLEPSQLPRFDSPAELDSFKGDSACAMMDPFGWSMQLAPSMPLVVPLDLPSTALVLGPPTQFTSPVHRPVPRDAEDELAVHDLLRLSLVLDAPAPALSSLEA